MSTESGMVNLENGRRDELAYALRGIGCDTRFSFTEPELFIIAQAVERLLSAAPASPPNDAAVNIKSACKHKWRLLNGIPHILQDRFICKYCGVEAPDSPHHRQSKNAESEAKLVSDEALELAKRCETMASFIWTEQNELTRAKRHECEDILCKAGKWIERHATPQTQATHGEGEAVACKHDGAYTTEASAYTAATKIICNQCGQRITHPAPSPTAAPALGELAKLQRWDVTYDYVPSSGYEICETPCEGGYWVKYEDLAALSGVAAQGDTKA